MMDLQNASETDMGLMSKNCCPEQQRDPCDLDKGQNSKAHECAIRASRAVNDIPSDALVAVPNSTENPYLKGFGPKHHIFNRARSATIYLQNLSLIC
jgi:hypothetical protein